MGEFVLFGTLMDGTSDINGALYRTLQTFGLNPEYYLSEKSGFAMIGRKGLAPNLAPFSKGIVSTKV